MCSSFETWNYFVCVTSPQEMILENIIPKEKIVIKVFVKENLSSLSNIEAAYFSGGKFMKYASYMGIQQIFTQMTK